MVRTQIQFTDTEIEALRQVAAARGISVSAVVREAVEASLANPLQGASWEDRKSRALAAAGRFHSGLGDLSARHDEYFADSTDE